MIQTMTFTNFYDAFKNSSRKDSFSREALELIFEYIEETDADQEFDLVGICCDYEEASLDDFLNDYSHDSDISEIQTDLENEEIDEDDAIDKIESFLRYNTTFLGKTSDGFVFVTF